MTLDERDQDILALGRLLSYAQLEARRLDLDKTDAHLRAAVSALASEAADSLTTADAVDADFRFDRA